MEFGRYELIELIGTGGMAEVFLAIQRGPRGVAKRLVIKRIAASRASDPHAVALFEQEARIGCALSHSNLVAVFDFGRVADHWFIAMEHVDGCDLASALDAADACGSAMPDALIAYVAAEACRGLGHVHAHGYIHRDVTPRNILLSWDGLVRLTDYGIAVANHSDCDRRVRGTRRFMAPEQAAAGAIDARADIYACGAVIGSARPRDARLAAIAATATAAAPAARFVSADALRVALEPIAADVDDRCLAAWLAAIVAPRIHAADGGASSGAAAVQLASASTMTRSGDHTQPQLAPLDALLARPSGSPHAARPARRAASESPGALRSDRRPHEPAASSPWARRLYRRGPAIALIATALIFGQPHVFTGRSAVLDVPCRTGDGYYCGRTLQTFGDLPPGALDDDTLYVCSGGHVSMKEICRLGCQARPPGEADICRWRTPTPSRTPRPAPTWTRARAR